MAHLHLHQAEAGQSGQLHLYTDADVTLEAGLSTLNSLYHMDPGGEDDDDDDGDDVTSTMSHMSVSSDSQNDTGDDSHDNQLQADVDLIRRLLPRTSAEEIRDMLSKQLSNPSRVRVVLNQILEGGESTSVPPAAAIPDPSSSNVTHPIPQPQHEHLPAEDEGGPKLKATNGLKVKNSSYQKNIDSRHPQQMTSTGVKRSGTFEQVEELGAIPKQRRRNNDTKEAGEVGNGMMEVPSNTSDVAHPPIVDLELTPSPPPAVQVADNAAEERRKLLFSLMEMFPNASKQYLEEHIPNIVGNPAATDEFISNMLSVARLSREAEDQDLHKTGDPQEPPCHGPWRFCGPDVELERRVDAEAEEKDDLCLLRSTFNHDYSSSSVDDDIEGKGVEEAEIDEPIAGPSNARNEIEQVPEPVAGPSTVERVETEEEKIQRQFLHLEECFPDTDPEFLYERARYLYLDETALNSFVDEAIESRGKNFPTREDYEKRREHELVLEKYSKEMSVEDILEIHPDPEGYFGNEGRKVTKLYKVLSLMHLKKEFRLLSSAHITAVWNQKHHLYYPTFKELKRMIEENPGMHRRKTKRPDIEISTSMRGQEWEMGQDTNDPASGVSASQTGKYDLNLLKELQFCRIEDKVRQHLAKMKKRRELKMDAYRLTGQLEECVCCYSEDVMPEEMFPCRNGHRFCSECIKRAAEVAVGEGKTSLCCLGQCEDSFELSTLQLALDSHMFSKWLKKIQLAEVEKADIEGLERCPFCEFATIMDTTPEENKIFRCLNPECGKESCRLCKELSHIPLHCDEVEKDGEVRKRTYIENKMTEALIRQCYRCKKPFFKTEGCNKMKCACGAEMCYLCREPVTNYRHFYGQGAAPGGEAKCPLWSDNKLLMEQDVAKGAFDAKSEMEVEQPGTTLKHDPTKGLKRPNEVADPHAAAVSQGPFARLQQQQRRQIQHQARQQQVLLQQQQAHLLEGYRRIHLMRQGQEVHVPRQPVNANLHFANQQPRQARPAQAARQPPLPPPPPPAPPAPAPPAPEVVANPVPGGGAAAAGDQNNGLFQNMGRLLENREAMRRRDAVIQQQQQLLEIYRRGHVAGHLQPPGGQARGHPRPPAPPNRPPVAPNALPRLPPPPFPLGVPPPIPPPPAAHLRPPLPPPARQGHRVYFRVLPAREAAEIIRAGRAVGAPVGAPILRQLQPVRPPAPQHPRQPQGQNQRAPRPDNEGGNGVADWNLVE